MQRLGQAILDLLGARLPMAGLVNPVAAIGDVGPSAHMSDALGQLVDVALGAIETRYLVRHPVVRQASLDQEAVELREQTHMRIGHQLAEVRYLADLPQQRDTIA